MVTVENCWDAKKYVLLQTILFSVAMFQDDVFLESGILKPRRIVADPILEMYTIHILLYCCSLFTYKMAQSIRCFSF